MKTILKVAALVALLVAGASVQTPARAATVVYQSTRFTGTANNLPITIHYTTQGMLNGGLGTFGRPLVCQPVGGVVTTNLLAGNYLLQIDQVGQSYPFAVPPTSQTYNIWDLVQNGLYVLGSTNGGGTNVLPAGILTNGQSGVALAGSFAGDGSGLTNTIGSGSFQQVVVGQSNYWYWTASIGGHPTHGEFTTLLSSPNGTNWTRLLPGVMYADPDCYSNNADGPITTEFTPYVDYAQNCFWAVYNYDPYNTNLNAQALGLAQSFDMTNWTRVNLLYLMGKTNAGAMFAATWFDDDNGRHYMVGAYNTGPFNAKKNLYVWERLDGTFQNYGPPVEIMAAGTGTGNSTWDGWLVKSNATYYLFYLDGGGQLAVAHRSDLNGLFAFDKELDTVDGFAYSNEAPAIFKLSNTTWRLYSHNGFEYVAESTDSGVTWPITGAGAPVGFWPSAASPDNTAWHGPGIFRMSRPLTNYVVRAAAVQKSSAATVVGVVGYATNATYATNWTGLAQSNGYAGSFNGNGAGLTNLSAANIMGGVITNGATNVWFQSGSGTTPSAVNLYNASHNMLVGLDAAYRPGISVVIANATNSSTEMDADYFRAGKSFIGSGDQLSNLPLSSITNLAGIAAVATNNAGSLTNLPAANLVGTLAAGSLPSGVTNFIVSSLKVTNSALANNGFVTISNSQITFSSSAAEINALDGNLNINSDAVATGLFASGTASAITSTGLELGSGTAISWALSSVRYDTKDAWIRRQSPGVVLFETNGIFKGTITATNGHIYPPLASGPAFASIGLTNVAFCWSSNNTPPTVYWSYFGATSNRMDTFHIP